MPRIKTGPTRRAKHKKILTATKGYRMTKSRLIKVAKEAVLHAGEYAFSGRKKRKQDFRKLWIIRINAALNSIEGAPKYSRFIKALSDKKILLDRKVLAHFAAKQPSIFHSIVKQVDK